MHIVLALLFVCALLVAALLHRRLKYAVAGLEEAKSLIEETRRQAEGSLKAKEGLDKEISALKELLQKQEGRIEDLKTALNSNSFDGRFPICSKCKDIRDEKGCWHTIEEFIAGLSEAEFSHSLCPDCAKELYPDMFEEGKKLHTLTWK